MVLFMVPPMNFHPRVLFRLLPLLLFSWYPPKPEQIWQLSAVPFCFTFFSFSRWRALPHTLPWECHIQQGARRWLRSAAFLSSLIKRQLPVKSLGQKQETDLLLCSGTDEERDDKMIQPSCSFTKIAELLLCFLLNPVFSPNPPCPSLLSVICLFSSSIPALLLHLNQSCCCFAAFLLPWYVCHCLLLCSCSKLGTESDASSAPLAGC